MKKKYIIGTSIAAVIGLLFLFALVPVESPDEVSVFSGGMGYKAIVCSKITREDGSVEELGCKSNTVTYVGRNATRDYLIGGATEGFDDIELECADNLVNAENTSLGSACTGALARANANTSITEYTDIHGNWTVTHEFTSDATVTVYGAGLFNGTSDANNVLLALANFTTEASLESNDKLNVTWQIEVS